MEKRIWCIRGAVCAENTSESITSAVGQLWTGLLKSNKLDVSDVVSIQFSVTPDLDELNPATALRRSDHNSSTASIPLFCAQEPVIKNMKSKVIRILVTAYQTESFTPVPVYLNGAQSLRPDLDSGDKRYC